MPDNASPFESQGTDTRAASDCTPSPDGVPDSPTIITGATRIVAFWLGSHIKRTYFDVPKKGN